MPIDMVRSDLASGGIWFSMINVRKAMYEEYPRTWPLADLSKPPMVDTQGFFAAKEFVVHRTFLNDNKKGGLAFPPHTQLSSDHTHPRWRFTSHRRLKNVIVVMEWLPSVDATAPQNISRARLGPMRYAACVATSMHSTRSSSLSDA